MVFVQYLQVLACVLMIAAGQVMFKWAGINISSNKDFLFSKGFWIAGAAIALYGFATIVWIYLLRNIPLSVAYPFMALSYVLVPLAAWVFFSEQITLTYMAGIALIILGVLVTTVRA